jgi:predicted RNA-binding Zn-ribbon protein involved in translation (DUF1610 family)
MPITAVCPSCQSKVRAPDKAAGKRVKCPKCGAVLDVPTPAPAWVAEQTAAPSLTLAATELPAAKPLPESQDAGQPVGRETPLPSYHQMRRELAWINFRQQVRSTCDSIGLGPDRGIRLIVVLVAAAGLFAVSMVAAIYFRADAGFAVTQAVAVAIVSALVGTALFLLGDDDKLTIRRDYLLPNLPKAKTDWEESKARAEKSRPAPDGATAVEPYRSSDGGILRGASLVPTSGALSRVGELKACPFCGEEILAVAKKCKHCGETIDVTLRAAEEAQRYAGRPSGSSVASNRTIVHVHNDQRPFNHGLHFLLTVLTCGAWLPIWIIAYIFHQ